MSNKVKRKVTVENNKDSADHPRRPSVFERLGPGAVSISSQSQDRHSRSEQQEKCRNWLRTGSCAYGNTCRYQHDPYPNSSRRGKGEKEIDEKDLRHKVRNKREENKESRTGSVSPKRKGTKRNGSRSRKGEHESKIKSTVVVTRPRSPTAAKSETEEREKKKPEGSWEDDSDDWPLDAAQLDYKEELTLERKRQQLQRELELELQKERMLNENVTITKTVSFSESSSSSSSSDSGSISSSSDSSSSSSDDDSDDDSSSSSSSSSSSGSRQRSIKRRIKKPQITKEISSEKATENTSHQKPREDYDKIKSSRAAKCSGARAPSPCPSPDLKSRKGGRDKRNITPPPVSSPKRRSCHEPNSSSSSRGNTNVRTRGPRTPSPPVSRKQRQWDQSSSADSRSTDFRRNRGKRHKKKREAPRNDKYKSSRAPTPPPLSSPNRTAVPPNAQFVKKSRQRGNVEDSYLKSRQRGRESSPLLLTRNPVHSNSPNVRLLGSHRNYSPEQDKTSDKQRQSLECSKSSLKKSIEDISSRNKRSVSRDRPLKRARASPRKDIHKESISPLREKMEGDGLLGGPGRKMYSSPLPHVEKLEDRNDRRKHSMSPVKGKEQRDRRKAFNDLEKKRETRDISPRNNRDNLGRDNLHRNNDTQSYLKKDNELRGKRGLSPEIKKVREDKNRERNQRERNNEHETLAWNDEHKKAVAPLPSNRITEPRARQELQSLQSASSTRRERSRESERDRKKVKERDISLRAVDEADRERQRLPSPIRSQSPLRSHHPVREVEAPLPVRSRIYDPEVPTSDREYAYGYETREAMYISDRLLPPEYDTAILRGPPLYSSDMYPDPRYRRDTTLKDPGPIQHLDRIGSYSGRDMLSARDILPPRDVMGIQARNDDYLPELPVDDRHAYDERWNRSRPLREEWDPYAALPPGPLPVHLAPVLDEDRYGMPRRRRAGSTEWQLARADERDLPPSPIGHRQPPAIPPLPLAPREQRTSRSPQPKRIADIAPANRGPWEHTSRHGSRTNDNHHENQQRNQDEKKVRGRRERRDRGRRRDVPSNDIKNQTNSKLNNKRPHSSSPSSKESKKRKEEITASSEPVTVADKGSSKLQTPKQEYSLDVLTEEFQRYRLDKLGIQEPRCTGILPTSKRIRDEPKSEQKVPVTSRCHKPSKSEPSSPKSSVNSRSSTQDKVEAPQKNSHVIKIPTKPEKEEKKARRNNDEKTQVDDDFSDWSDGDDELLNRDDFNESEVNNETENIKVKDEESQDNKNCKHIANSAEFVATDDGSRHSKDTSQELRQKMKETASQPLNKNENKESVNETTSQASKDPEPTQETKEIESIDSFMVKDETDMDGYITTESVDYDPISDDELETPLEDLDDALMKSNDQGENSRIADALDVNWSTLMSESRSKPDFVPGLARRQFKTVHVLSRIGFSQALAGPELTEKIFNYCQQQLDDECDKQNEGMLNEEERKKFTMEHQIAAFHVAISESKKERTNILSNLGPYRRALCARRDLQIRKQLCKPTNKLFDPVPAMYSQQHNVDKDLYKQSLELLKQKKSEYLAQTVNVAC